MNRINKYLLLFGLTVFLACVLVIKFIEGEAFSRNVSRYVTKSLKLNEDFSFSYKYSDVGFFPPKTTIHGISLSSLNSHGNDINAAFKSLSIRFSLWDFFTRKITISELVLDDGRITAKIPNILKNTQATKLKAEQVVQDVFKNVDNVLNISNDINVRNLKIHKTKLNVNNRSATVNSLSASKIKKGMSIKLNVDNININDSTILDELYGSFEIYRNKVKVYSISVHNYLDRLDFQGEVNSNKKVDGKLRFRGSESLKKFMPKGHKLDGTFDLTANLIGNVDDLEVSSNIEITNLENKFHNADVLTTQIESKKGIVFINSFNSIRGNSKVELNKPFKIFDLSNKKLSLNNIELNLSKSSSKHLLHFDKNLSILNFEAQGKVKVNLANEILLIKPDKDLKVTGFKLLGADSKPILDVRKLMLNNYSIEYNFPRSTLKLDLPIVFENTKFLLKGHFDKSGFSINTKNALIDLYHFGPIVSQEIRGQYRGDIKVTKVETTDKFSVALQGQHVDLALLDINLGTGSNKLIFDIPSSDLKILTFNSKFRSVTYLAHGNIKFKDKQPLNITVNIQNGIFEDLMKLLPKPFEKIKKETSILGFDFSATGKIRGGLSPEQLKVTTQVRSSNINFLGEQFQSADFKFRLEDSTLNFENISIVKLTDTITGDFRYKLNTAMMKYEIDLNGLRLTDFQYWRFLNLNLDGEVFGKITGNGNIKNLVSEAKLKLTRSYIENNLVPDSIIDLSYSHNKFLFNMQVLKELKVNMVVNLNKDKNALSFFNINFNSKSPNRYFGIISKHNFQSNIKGSVDLNMNGSLNLYNQRFNDLSFKINKMQLSKNELNFRAIDNQEILIKDGKVLKGTLRSPSGENNFKLEINGDINKAFVLDGYLNLDAGFLEVLSPRLIQSTGKLESRFLLKRDGDSFQNFFQNKSKNVTLQFANVPGQIKDLNFQFVAEKNNWILQDAQASYGNGTIHASGILTFKLPYPLIDIKMMIKDSQISILKKSSTNINGSANLKGNSPPYQLSGNFIFSNSKILDEFSEVKNKKTVSSSYEKYLPKNESRKSENFINLDINTYFSSPLRVKNSLADLSFIGGIDLDGPIENPLVSSKLQIIKGESKFKFKGHEFLLDVGEINLNENVKDLNPYLRFSGSSLINEYKVNLAVAGKSDQLPLELSSEPSLSREDILSLLAFGYTSDISKNLSGEDKRSITTIGIGTLLVDQFKINENLSNTLGVRVSVAPEFSSENPEILQGKDATSGTSASKVKTATKVKVQKKIGAKLDWSVSSTVGGSLEPKQEMNVNYNINKDFSIEGVYERKASDLNSEDEPDSAGVDFKWRNTFK